MNDVTNEFKGFTNNLIDELPKTLSKNYFSPVWDEVIGAGYKPERLLDFGCGNGVFGMYAKVATGCKLVGVDGSLYALEQAKEMGLDETHKIEDFCSSVLPLEDNSFDFVLCKDVFEHLLDPEFALREISRVLIKKGKFLFHVPNHFPLKSRLRFLFTNNIDTFGYFPNNERWEYPHIRFFTEASLKKFFDKHGFTIEMKLSHHFGCLPFSRFFPPNSKTSVKLSKKSADQFSEGYTLLLSKQ